MSSDTLIRTSNLDGHDFELRHFFDTTLCYDLLQKEAEDYWNSKGKKSAEENYLFHDGKAWSLGEMLKRNEFELGYSVLFKDGKFLAGGGIRKHSEKETISLARFFCWPSPYPFANAFILPLHIELGREAGFKETLITFNEYNKHLLNYYLKILPKKSDPASLLVYNEIRNFRYTGIETINFVDQHVLRLSLS